MKIILWNCGGGLGTKEKISYLKSFDADLAIIPELRESNIKLINPSEHIWITNNVNTKNPKGLGILAFNGVSLEKLPHDSDMEIFIPTKVKAKQIEFNLLAVWNFYHACKNGRYKDVKGEHCLEYSAINHYRTIFTDPILIAGDWNLGPTFSQASFLKINNLLLDSNILSLYHKFNKLPLTETLHPTFRSTRKSLHHLDHFFGSEYFQKNLSNISIEPFTNVIGSDHSPIIVNISK